MSQQERDKNFGAPQNGDPFTDENAVQVDYDLTTLEASTSDDPASQTDAGEPNDAAGQTTNKPGEDTVEIPRREYRDLVERIKQLETALGIHEMTDAWTDEEHPEVNVKNRLDGLSDKAARITPLETQVEDLEKQNSVTDIFGEAKTDEVARLIVENFEELSTNGTVKTGGRGRKGVCSLINEKSDLDVHNKTVRDALRKIDEKLVDYSLVDEGEFEGDMLIRGGDQS